jgi:outer membrane protein OmpA-like peptidoglycan-associated protein
MATPTLHRTLGGALALILATAAPAVAQVGKGTQVELGTFGTFTKFDNSDLGFGDEFGAGGRLAIFFSRLLSLEASGDYTETNAGISSARITATRIGGTLFAHAPIGGSAWSIGLGYERLFYRAAQHFNDGGIHLIMGPRVPLGARAAFRVEGIATYVPSSNAPLASGASINLSATAGLSIYSFGGPTRDADHDSVRDSKDDCPATPDGASVDKNGCPTDSDTDGVLDGLDQCPATPGGADVDAVGCPSDDDMDGVFNGIDICPDTPAGSVADENGCPADQDNDSVLDGIDICPDTPAGATVDADGCPSDEDTDGVYDGIDQCTGTPEGVMVDEVGCPQDQDQDGVFDHLDLCPDTPPNTMVDENGCQSDTDTDLDGVSDRLDRCPSTPAGTTVDSVGCPVLFVVDEATGREQPLILQGVNFAVGSSRLTQDSYAVLNVVAVSLLAHPDVRIEVGGHTDATGGYDLNMRLSRGRAEAVRAYLAQQGVPLSQMEAQGYGPDQPIATNATSSGRAANRRVELKRIN